MSAQDPEARTESIPEPSQILRDMVVRKKSSDGIFVARRVVVSRTTLFFAPEGEDLILDDIHLYEIESIEVIEVERKMKKAKGGAARVPCWERFQRKLKGFYDSNFCQAAVACLIMISFLCNVVKLEVDPGGANPDLQKTFTALELLFTIVFCMELAVNMTAKWFWLFWEDNWNRFDFFVVITSLVATIADTVVDTESDGASDSKAVYAVRAVRLLRAFRVMRLFRQIESIHKIVNALGLSLVPLGNAFFIVFLILSVYGTRVQM